MHTLVNEYQICAPPIILFHIFLPTSSRFLTIKTRGVFDTLTPEVKSESSWKMDSKMWRWSTHVTHKRIQKWLPINLRIFQVTISPLILQKYTQKGECKKGTLFNCPANCAASKNTISIFYPPWTEVLLLFQRWKIARKVNLISAWIACLCLLWKLW